MKTLGWILFLAVSTSVYAQVQVIEGAPLSVDDEGGRKIINRKEGDLAPKTDSKVQIVPPPPRAEALTIPNDEVVNPPESVVAENKKASKKKNKKSKAIAQVMPKETIQEKMAAKEKLEAKEEVVPVIAPAPIAKAPVAVVAPVVSIPTPATNPQDGQLKLGTVAPVVTAKKVEVVKAETPVILIGENAPVVESTEVIIVNTDSGLKKYVQFSYGYIDSRYEKIHPSLDNGSLETSFRFVTDVNHNLQSGFAVEILSDTSGQTIPDNIRVLQYRLFADYHAPLFERGSFKIDWIGGLAFSIGDFGIKRRYLNTQGEEVSVKIKSGNIIGLIPSAGMRFYLVGKSSFDLVFEYHQYFGNPQKYIGGPAVAPRISFEF